MKSNLSQKAIAEITEQGFDHTGAHIKGHYILKSGKHGIDYLSKGYVEHFPLILDELCYYMALGFVGHDIDTIVAPMSGAPVIGSNVARHLAALEQNREPPKFVRALKLNDEEGNHIGFRYDDRSALYLRGKNVGVTEDIVTRFTTGDMVKRSFEEHEAVLRRFGSLVSRGTFEDESFFALWWPNLSDFPPGKDTCPGCADHAPYDTVLGCAKEPFDEHNSKDAA